MPKKFVYKYERLLKIREIEEQKEIAEHNKIINRIINTEKNISRKKQEVEELRKKVEELDTFPIEDLRYYSDLNNRTEGKIAELQDKLKKLRKKEEEQKKKVIEASKKRKILEKLQEKHREDFFKAENKALNKFMDELGTQKFFRPKR